MQRTLLVTNDFPPRAGGIQTFLEGFVGELDPDELIVYASTPPDSPKASGAQLAQDYDATLPYKVVRYPHSLMLPTPDVKRRMQELIRTHQVVNVWFGSSVPLGLLARAAHKAGASNVVATTHGHEIGWSMLPGARQLLRKVFRDSDVVTYLTQATLRRLKPFTSKTNLMQLHGAMDPKAFAFDAHARQMLRRRYGFSDTDTVVVCISRLVERKGQDYLIDVWPELSATFPDVKLLIVGKGPYEQSLRERAAQSPVAHNIIFTGEVPYAELAAHYCVGDVFAMPCRTRGGGLDIEGLGIVYLEAYAAGIPVLAGDSGGAPEAVQHGKTGVVVNGHNRATIRAGLEYLLEDPQRAKQMGESGRRWVHEKWTWHDVAQPLLQLFS